MPRPCGSRRVLLLKCMLRARLLGALRAQAPALHQRLRARVEQVIRGGSPRSQAKFCRGSEVENPLHDPEPAPAPKAAPAQDSGRAAQDCVEAESKPATEPASDPPWIQVVRGGKRSAAQGKERTGHDPGPPKLAPQAQRFQIDITDPKRWQRFAADRQARQAKSRESEHKAKTDPRGHQHLDPGDFPHRGKPGCSRCGDSTPTQLCNKPKVFSTLQGPPDDDSYRNVYVCNGCMKAKAAYAEIFTKRQVLHSDVPFAELPFPLRGLAGRVAVTFAIRARPS